MRALSKILLSACAVCAVGAPGAARAGDQPAVSPGPTPSSPAPGQQPDQVPPPPVPTDVPGQPPAPVPADPGAPNPNANPATPAPPPTMPAPDPGAPLPSTTPVPDTTPPAPDTTAAPAAPPVVVVPDQPVDSGMDMYSYAWSEPELPSGIGISTILGGGVTGFTDKTMRSTTSDLGGLWDLRVAIGSHLPIALEIGYVGSATNINGLPSGNKGTLIGTTVEGAVRFNMLPHYVLTPYIFGGAGWQRYDVTQTSVSLSDSGMNSQDNLLEFPVGAGFAYRSNGFVADVRGTFRFATDQNLVLNSPTINLTNPTSSDFAKMHTWEASAALGYEF